jgi:hypothetical protein
VEQYCYATQVPTLPFCISYIGFKNRTKFYESILLIIAVQQFKKISEKQTTNIFKGGFWHVIFGEGAGVGVVGATFAGAGGARVKVAGFGAAEARAPSICWPKLRNIAKLTLSTCQVVPATARS